MHSVKSLLFIISALSSSKLESHPLSHIDRECGPSSRVSFPPSTSLTSLTSLKLPTKSSKQIIHIHVESTTRKSMSSHISLRIILSSHVINSTSLRILQELICIDNLLKLLFCSGILLITIWMVFFRSFFKSLFNFFFIGIPRDT